VLVQFSTNMEARRAAWSVVVGKVADLLGGYRTVLNRDSRPIWVDVGSGDGALIMTAIDSGFAAVGLETVPQPRPTPKAWVSTPCNTTS